MEIPVATYPHMRDGCSGLCRFYSVFSFRQFLL